MFWKQKGVPSLKCFKSSLLRIFGKISFGFSTRVHLFPSIKVNIALKINWVRAALAKWTTGFFISLKLVQSRFVVRNFLIWFKGTKKCFFLNIRTTILTNFNCQITRFDCTFATWENESESTFWVFGGPTSFWSWRSWSWNTTRREGLLQNPFLFFSAKMLMFFHS